MPASEFTSSFDCHPMEPALRSANNTAMEDPQQRKSEIHALQVHAFLDAADEVDVDNDTVEDLLEGLEDDPASHAGEVRPDTDDALDLDENDGFDDPEYNALVEECNLFSYPIASNRLIRYCMSSQRTMPGPNKRSEE